MNGFPLVFANPWGALALLGIPAVIAIHCLQQKSRRLSVSTLFLLERLVPDSRTGRRLTWLRGSLAFWLQIVSVLVVTWILIDPRWLQANAVQRVVIVLDSSISMRAFTGDIVSRTFAPLRAVAGLAPRTYWTVLETDPVQPTLYEGPDLAAIQGRLRTWSPSLPANDPTHALALARALAPHDALVLFVTDRPHEVPSGVDVIGIGEPIENCGLVGLRLDGTGDDLEWQVLAQNYGARPAHRSWWIEFAGKKTEPAAIDLEPGHPQILHGRFPPNMDQITVCLEPDRFTIDDRMPIVRPKPKALNVAVNGDDATKDVFDRLMRTLPSLSIAGPGHAADLAFNTLGPHPPYPNTDASSLILFDNPSDSRGFLGEPFVVEQDALNQDLNWQGLIVQGGAMPPRDPNRRVLVWKGDTPVIYIQPTGNHEQLIFNFNFPTSNAARLPAFVLLVERFADSLRLRKQEPEMINAELTQPLSVAANATGPAIELHDASGLESTSAATAVVPVRAPSLPGFFTITQGKETIVTGAAGFADARESDFSRAATFDSIHSRHARLLEMHTRADVFTSLWLALIGLILLLYWAVTRRPAI